MTLGPLQNGEPQFAPFQPPRPARRMLQFQPSFEQQSETLTVNLVACTTGSLSHTLISDNHVTTGFLSHRYTELSIIDSSNVAIWKRADWNCSVRASALIDVCVVRCSAVRSKRNRNTAENCQRHELLHF